MRNSGNVFIKLNISVYILKAVLFAAINAKGGNALTWVFYSLYLTGNNIGVLELLLSCSSANSLFKHFLMKVFFLSHRKVRPMR